MAASYKLAYIENRKVGLQLATWSFFQYNATGDLERRIDGEVTEFAEGKRFKDAEFTFSFPVGTNIIEYTKDEKDGKRFWIQSSEGKMTPIDEKQYGRLPKEEEGSGGKGDAA